MSRYQDSGPIDCSGSVDTGSLKGKTAIVTGGASGIGKEYVRALAKAGVHVVIADLSEENGKKVQQETSGSTTFVRCDVTSWDDQLAAFKKAKEFSPNNEIDIVVANAGISTRDEIFANDIEKDEPEKPKIPVVDVNANGVLWTTKLAIFYFRKQNATNKRDRSLILQASLAGYLDLIGAPQYTSSKFFVRGLLRSLRQSEIKHGIRVNLIAPWYDWKLVIPGHK
jgi:NAD(P)-dependent dehydrogenase (short-subunit alcohol dehydrogenase family)